MSIAPFGISSSKGRHSKKLKVEALAAFNEPTDDRASETLTEAERDAEADKLQREGTEKAETGDFSSAIRIWDRALLLTPRRAVLHELKAQAFLEVDHDWDAICSATKAADLAPDWPEAFLTLARAQLSFGEPEEALTQMEKVLTLQPDHPDARVEIDTVRMLVLQRKKQPSSTGHRLHIV